MRLWLLLIFSLLTTKGSAQELFVFSELALLAGPTPMQPTCDAITKWQPYTSLSPAIQRGERLILLLAVQERAGKPFVISTGQYPAGALALKMYRLFPDTEEIQAPVQVPVELRSRVSESQRCALFLLEVAVPKTLGAGRIKLEPAIWVPDSISKDYWLRYPMEIRVIEKSETPHHPCDGNRSTLELLVLNTLQRWLDSCPALSEYPELARRIAEKRRIEGKNQ